MNRDEAIRKMLKNSEYLFEEECRKNQSAKLMIVSVLITLMILIVAGGQI